MLHGGVSVCRVACVPCACVFAFVVCQVKAVALTDAGPRVKPFTTAKSPSVALVPTSTVPAVASSTHTPTAIKKRLIVSKGATCVVLRC